jgi:hypothetical protein
MVTQSGTHLACELGARINTFQRANHFFGGKIMLHKLLLASISLFFAPFLSKQ